MSYPVKVKPCREWFPLFPLTVTAREAYCVESTGTLPVVLAVVFLEVPPSIHRWIHSTKALTKPEKVTWHGRLCMICGSLNAFPALSLCVLWEFRSQFLGL